MDGNNVHLVHFWEKCIYVMWTRINSRSLIQINLYFPPYLHIFSPTTPRPTHGCRGCGPNCSPRCSCPEMVMVRQAMEMGLPLEQVYRLGQHWLWVWSSHPPGGGAFFWGANKYHQCLACQNILPSSAPTGNFNWNFAEISLIPN